MDEVGGVSSTVEDDNHDKDNDSSATQTGRFAHSKGRGLKMNGTNT